MLQDLPVLLVLMELLALTGPRVLRGRLELPELMGQQARKELQVPMEPLVLKVCRELPVRLGLPEPREQLACRVQLAQMA